MAVRKRSLDPIIWQDPDFGTVSFLAQLIFIGCISNADDDGRLRGGPTYIRSTFFPNKEIPIEEVFDALVELDRHIKNFIYYEVEGEFYIQLLKWEEYQAQRPDRRVQSSFPQPNLAKIPKLSAQCPPNVRHMTAEVSKEVSKEVSVSDNKNLSAIDAVRAQLEAKGLLKAKMKF